MGESTANHCVRTAVADICPRLRAACRCQCNRAACAARSDHKSVPDEVHRSAITSTAEGDRLNLEESVPHWQQLRNSLMPAHEARFLALRQCYYRYWSLQQPAPSRSDHLENAGIYIQMSGGWAVRPLSWRLAGISPASSSVPGRPSRSPACGCAAVGRGGRRTTIAAAMRALAGI